MSPFLVHLSATMADGQRQRCKFCLTSGHNRSTCLRRLAADILDKTTELHNLQEELERRTLLKQSLDKADEEKRRRHREKNVEPDAKDKEGAPAAKEKKGEPERPSDSEWENISVVSQDGHVGTPSREAPSVR